MSVGSGRLHLHSVAEEIDRLCEFNREELRPRYPGNETRRQICRPKLIDYYDWSVSTCVFEQFFEYVSRGLSLWTGSLVRKNFKLQRCIPGIFVACSLVCVFSD